MQDVSMKFSVEGTSATAGSLLQELGLQIDMQTTLQD